MADEDLADIPRSMRQLRACLRCGLVKEFDQFYKSGCDNCPSLFDPEDDNHQAVNECTTVFFEGLIGMFQPTDSWVARWQHADRLKPGLYAVSVTGTLPDAYQEMMRQDGQAAVIRRQD